MRSVDTNVIVRWLLRDDPVQAAAADSAMNAPIEITHTVFLELGWVLTTVGRMSREQFADAMVAILSIDDATIEKRKLLLWATDRFRGGADWGDVMHLAGTSAALTFATFDKSLPREAGSAPPVPVEVIG